MKIHPSPLLNGMSGRLDDETYLRYNRRTGVIYASRMPRRDYSRATPAQAVQRQSMRHRAEAARRWCAQHKPRTDQPQGSAEYQALIALWRRDGTRASWYAMLLHLIQPDGTVPPLA